MCSVTKKKNPTKTHRGQMDAGVVGDRKGISRITCHALASWREWPNSSPYCCWWCTEGFDGRPWGVPVSHRVKIVDGVKGDHYEMLGNFCSASCAKAYALHEMPVQQRYKCSQWISQVSLRVNKTARVTCAPSRQALKKFGGPYTIDDFRRKGVNGWTCVLQTHSFSHRYIHIHEKGRGTSLDTGRGSSPWKSDSEGVVGGTGAAVPKPPTNEREDISLLPTATTLKRSKPPQSSALGDLMGVKFKKI